MARLNVWMRMAIVITVVWLLGGTAYFHLSTMKQRSDFGGTLFKWCLESADSLDRDFPDQDHSKYRDSCSTSMNAYFVQEQKTEPASKVLLGSFIDALIIAVLCWILGGIGFLVTRWVMAGRKRVPDQEGAA